MSDEFDEIIANQPDRPEDSDGKLENIWEALEHFWPNFYEGLLIKGVLIVEYVDKDGGRGLRFVSAPETAPWEMLGMLESALEDARDLSRSCSVVYEEDDDD